MTANGIRTIETDGWALYRDLLDPSLVLDARQQAEQRYPTVQEVKEGKAGASWVTGDEFSSLLPWPTGLPAVDAIPLTWPVVRLARELIGTDDIQLLRAGLQCKYAGAARYEQVHHYEYYDHCLIVPTDAPGDRLVGMFVYLSDVTEDNGPTAIVSSRLTGHLSAKYRLVESSTLPWLYEKEEHATGPAGSVLVHTTKTYHRATEVRRGSRLTLSLAFAPRRSWYGFVSWPRLGESDTFTALVPGLEPWQRALIGFPDPGDPYWNDAATRQELAHRYGVPRWEAGDVA